MRPSVAVRAAALGIGALAPLVVLGALAQLDLFDAHPLAFACGVCGALALGLGLRWPGGSWRWGAYVSWGFWAFLGLTAVGYARAGRLEWHPVAEAGAITLAACLASGLGSLGVGRRGAARRRPVG